MALEHKVLANVLLEIYDLRVLKFSKHCLLFLVIKGAYGLNSISLSVCMSVCLYVSNITQKVMSVM